ncbi:MAG: hypothetical protein CME32_30460 [Gimesia sp.]|uniref:CBM-cenC domain-containing protein n=1 Tax=Gimesia benthica TaxID=2608982 RepID=A0A6I6ACL0_9PLAN|nr:hypothetical protein [Gimesia benthica]MBN73597.1 hypothetical protein [Gimesia sp.]QGQ24264.1 hypothetical protein F1728_16920 [Gimesia benthica]
MEIMLTMLLGVATAAGPTVINADFEQKDVRTGLPTGWSYTSLPGRQHLVNYQTTQVTAAKKQGSALSITVASDHPEQIVAYNIHQDLQGLTPGKAYRVSARVCTKGLKTMPMIVVQCIDASGRKFVGMARSPQRDLPGDLDSWEQIHTDIFVPEGTSTVRLRIGIPAAGNAGGTAIIDDVDIVEMN